MTTRTYLTDIKDVLTPPCWLLNKKKKLPKKIEQNLPKFPKTFFCNICVWSLCYMPLVLQHPYNCNVWTDL